MTIDQFWNIVEKVHRDSEGDMDRKCELLEAELRRLPLDEVDKCPEDTLNRILWHAMKGSAAPFPACGD